MNLTIALCAALSVSIAIASLVSYLEGIGENLLAAFVLAAALVVGWAFVIYMRIKDAA